MEQNRAHVIDENFIRKVQRLELPESAVSVTLADAGLTGAELLDLFESQVMSRQLDLHSRKLQARGESFYTIGSAGHEGNAALAKAFRPTDMAFLHYRSGAFFIQRSKQVPGQTPLEDLLLSFSASSDDPIAGGRHKVLGSKSLFIPPQTSTIASHLPKAVGAAFSIPLAKRLAVPTVMPSDAVVLCSFGDASTNHSTAQGAINAAAWAGFQGAPLPLVFVCEDNGIGISTPTPPGWIHANFSKRPGLHYLTCDGLNLLDTYRCARQAVELARHHKQPVFVHMRTVRLMGHAGSDAEIAYLSEQQIELTEAQDPLLHSARLLLENRILSAAEIIHLYQDLGAQIGQLAERIITRPKITTTAQLVESLAPRRPAIPALQPLTPSQLEPLFADQQTLLAKPQPMAKLLSWALAELMTQRPNVILCGEDIGAKGGVYHVTQGLYKRFGAGRVINTLLDEQSILGLALGCAHNGLLPIPEIQFLAYVHNAEDQIRGEAATLSFFSKGQFSNPMVLRIAGLAYQKGFGGHFHNDNSLAVLRDIPGLVIACPSNGADAVEMLRTAVTFAAEQQRVVVFIEPIALYMTRDLHQEGDGLWSSPYLFENQSIQQGKSIAVGEFQVHVEGDQDCVTLCILTYGNGYYLSRQAARILDQQHGESVSVIDLRWLAPLDEDRLIQELSRFKRVLIIDECRKTGSLSEALVTLLVEHLAAAPVMKRLTGIDCFIPLGKAATLGLPKRDEIVETVLGLLAK